MKFALLIAAVSAVTIQRATPSSGDDPEHSYSVHVNNAHKAIMDKSDQDRAHRSTVLDAQEKNDEWRKGFNPKA